jgi:hypothetical protein
MFALTVEGTEMNDLQWMAVRTAGKFRRGRIYNSAELGVLGRMAVKAGFLQPYTPPTPRTAKPPAKKGGRRGKVPVQPGAPGPDNDATDPRPGTQDSQGGSVGGEA